MEEAKGGAIVDDPIGAGSEKGLVIGGGTNGENASAGGFAGTRAGGSIFDDDTILRGETEVGGTFGVGFGIGLAVMNVGGGDEMMDMVPEARGTEADVGESARGRSDDGELPGSSGSEEGFGAGESDDVSDVFDFGALHPIVFGEMDGGVGVWEKFADRSETGAAMGELDGGVGVEIVLAGPAGPDASDRGSGVDKDAIHVDKETSAGDLRHGDILAGNGGVVGSWPFAVRRLRGDAKSGGSKAIRRTDFSNGVRIAHVRARLSAELKSRQDENATALA